MTVYELIVALQKQVAEGHGNADVLIVSDDGYKKDFKVEFDDDNENVWLE